MPDTISVIVPVYNVEAYLEACLDSIINSSYTGLEIICVNDGSTDGSADIIHRFQKSDSRIVVIEQENRGLSAASNTGLEAATGEYVCFIDSDDRVDAKYFEYLKKALDETNAQLSQCRYLRLSDDKSAQYDTDYHVTTKDKGVLLSEPMVWHRLYRKELIGKLRFDPEAQMEDVVFSCGLLAMNPDVKVADVSAVLYLHFNRAGSLSGRFTLEGVMTSWNKMLELGKKSCREDVREAIFRQLLRVGLSKRYVLILLKKNRRAIEQYNGLMRSTLDYKKRDKLYWRYYFFLLSPTLYRVTRLIHDPSMLKWEKLLKQGVVKDSISLKD